MDERSGRERFGRRYEDEERRFDERGADDYEGRRYRGEGYYGGYYQPSRSRGDYGRAGDYGRSEDRGFFDRAGDEVRSWFGDEEAERRRRRDELEAGRRGWQSPWRPTEGRGDDREWSRQWGYVDRPYERRGMGEDRSWWEDRDWTSRRRSTMGYDFGPGAGGDVWMSRGPYAGRGPKGYQRSDERIKEDVCERLCERGDLDASDIEVLVVNRIVTLQGSVANRGDKRLAEDLTDSVSGVSEVQNQLRVNQGQGTEQRPVDWRHRAA